MSLNQYLPQCQLFAESMHISPDPKQRAFISFGALTTIMGFVDQIQVLEMQQICWWAYLVGVSRVQTKLRFPSERTLFFTYP